MIVTDHHLRALIRVRDNQPFPRRGMPEKTLEDLLSLRFIQLTGRNTWAVTAEGKDWLQTHPAPREPCW